MSSSITNVDPVQTLLSIAQNLNGIVGLIIIILGIPANFLAIFVIFQIHSWKKLTSLIILFTSIISDQLVLFSLIPRVYFGFTGIDPTNSYIFLCKIRLFIAYSCPGVSISCICLICMDQYLLSCTQLSRHRLLIPQRVKWILLAINIFWLTAYLPHTIFYNLIPYTSGTFICVNINSNYMTYVTYFSLICYSIIPVIILLLFFLFTLRNLRRFEHIRQRKSALQKSVTKTMTILIILVLTSTLPTSINQLYMIITRSFIKSRLQSVVEYLILTILALIVYSSYGTTLFVFIFGSTLSRQRTKRILFSFVTRLRLRCRNGRIEPQGTTIPICDTGNVIQSLPMPHVQIE